MAFSTLILTLAKALDCMASCDVNFFWPRRKEGIVKKLFSSIVNHNLLKFFGQV